MPDGTRRWRTRWSPAWPSDPREPVLRQGAARRKCRALDRTDPGSACPLRLAVASHPLTTMETSESPATAFDTSGASITPSFHPSVVPGCGRHASGTRREGAIRGRPRHGRATDRTARLPATRAEREGHQAAQQRSHAALVINHLLSRTHRMIIEKQSNRWTTSLHSPSPTTNSATGHRSQANPSSPAATSKSGIGHSPTPVRREHAHHHTPRGRTRVPARADGTHCTASLCTRDGATAHRPGKISQCECVTRKPAHTAGFSAARGAFRSGVARASSPGHAAARLELSRPLPQQLRVS